MTQNPIVAHFQHSLAALTRAVNDATLLTTVETIATAIVSALRAGNKVLLVGNGGSAADAQHIAAEIVGRYKRDRSGYAAIALTTDTSALTAITNDYGFEQVFSRQVEGLGQRGDVLLQLVDAARPDHQGRDAVVAQRPGERELGEGLAALGAEYEQSMAASIPLKKLGTVEDIGYAALFLASKEAGYITGQTIIVDGGQILPESMDALAQA